jgi:hypothetical protein
MRRGRGFHGFGRLPRRGIFIGLHHGLGGGILTVLLVVALVVVVVLALRGRR